MKRNIIETVLGAVVLLVAGLFLTFSYSTSNVGAVSGYEVKAVFDNIGGLSIGDKVVVSGVKVGSVSDVVLNKETYLAEVILDIEKQYQIPDDTGARITSESLLGGLYMQLEPGGSEDMIEPGGSIEYTQSPQNLEQLLGKFIFTMQNNKDSEEE